jgi:hypothetical protein
MRSRGWVGFGLNAIGGAAVGKIDSEAGRAAEIADHDDTDVTAKPV